MYFCPSQSNYKVNQLRIYETEPRQYLDLCDIKVSKLRIYETPPCQYLYFCTIKTTTQRTYETEKESAFILLYY